MTGFLLGGPLLGDSGVPFPKGERKEKNKLRSPRGDADYEAQKRRDRADKLGMIDRQQVKPVLHYRKDDIASHNVAGVSDKYDKKGVLRLHHGPEAQLPGFTFANDPASELSVCHPSLLRLCLCYRPLGYLRDGKRAVAWRVSLPNEVPPALRRQQDGRRYAILADGGLTYQTSAPPRSLTMPRYCVQ